MEYDEQQYYEAQYDEYLSECGSCPNCGVGTHISELGETDGIVKCIHCKDKSPQSGDTNQ